MTIKVGIIGAGGMLQYHAAGFQKAGAQIIAIADRNTVAAKQAGEKYGVTRVLNP
jgi:predicted dehydrogenase